MVSEEQTVIDRRYAIQREIARGGVGVIYEARQTFTGRTYALKLLRQDSAEDPTAGQRLLREARALGTLRHPNVVDVVDAGVCTRSGPYLVLELLAGATLDRILADRAQMPVEDVVAVGVAICAALSAAHAAGILHRDVKPANVFVTRAGPDAGEQVKVLDFGIANVDAAAPKPQAERLTKAGRAVGTPEYMAPEQLTLGAAVDQRCDVYATAMTLFHCLTGSVPYPGSFAEVVRKVRAATEPPPVRLLRPDVAPALASAIERALEPRRENRPASASAFAESLLRASGLREPRTKLFSHPQRSGLVYRRRKSRATISLSMLAVNDAPPGRGPQAGK